MKLSSGLRAGWDTLEDAVVAEQRPQHVDAPAGQSNERLDVFEPFSAFLEIEVAVGSLPHHGRRRRQVEHPTQLAGVTLRTMQVPRAPPRVSWHRHQPSGRGKPASGWISIQV